MIFSSTEEVQLVPSVIFNLYEVPAVQLVRLEPAVGCTAIPSNEPLCVIFGIVFENIGFTSSEIETNGLL